MHPTLNTRLLPSYYKSFIPGSATGEVMRPNGNFMSPVTTWLDGSQDPTLHAAAEKFIAHARMATEKQAKSFEDGVPNARVVRLSGGHHLVFASNEMDVLREMHAFVATLK